MVNVVTDRNIKRAAVVRAAGFRVITVKLPCSPRCGFEYPDTPEVNRVLETYERRETLPIPPKNILKAYSDLLGECKAASAGRMGGRA